VINLKRRKLLLVVLVILLAVSLTACGGNKPAPDPGAQAPSGPDGSEPITEKAADLLEFAMPNLEQKLSEGKITQEFMDDIISQINKGEITNKLQLMAKLAPYL
jgi:hypothetical protein